MKIDVLSGQVANALNVMKALQAQTVMNLNAVSAGKQQVERSHFTQLMAMLPSDTYVAPAQLQHYVERSAEQLPASQQTMAEEVLNAQRMAGRFDTLVNVYNRQLKLYQTAISGDRR